MPVLKKEEFKVTGLSCASCAVSAQSMLESLEGVKSVSVNFANAAAMVEYDTELLGLEEMNRQLESIGYGLEPDWQKSLEEKEAEEQLELRKAKTNAITAILLALPVFLISMVLPSFAHQNEVMLLLTLVVMSWSGREFFIIAWKQASHRKSNMDTLVALGTGAAFLFSVFNTVFPGYLISHGLEPHVYYEAAAVVIALVLLGRYFEAKAKSKTSASIKKLLNLGVKEAEVIRDSVEMIVPVSEVKTGDLLRIRPGDKIPVDGVLVKGSSDIDESMITGESLPVLKEEGSELIGATINGNGSFTMEATRVGAQTMLAQIIRMVKEAQSSKAPVQKLADKIAGIFVPAVISIALISFAIWWLAGPEPSLTYAFVVSVTVLVIACPCALGLATPTAIMVGVGRGAREGILIKNAESLEKIRKINAIVFDKTGTLTLGKPAVENIFWLDDELTYHKILSKLEKQSSHVLAESIVSYLKNQEDCVVNNFQNHAGKGVVGEIDSVKYVVGNKQLLDENHIEIAPGTIEKYEDEILSGNTIVFFAKQTKVLALISLSDPVKENAAQAVGELHKLGLETFLLTGDHEQAANKIAGSCGIKNIKAGVLPSGKADFIKELQNKGYHVAMVGDGINDSPALAQAEVGIAMGTGTDIAIETADITLLKGDLRKVYAAIDLSVKTLKTIRQNLFWAMFYNTLAIPVAAGILYPAFHFLLSPMIAGAAMAFSSVSVVSNSLRLRKK